MLEFLRLNEFLDGLTHSWEMEQFCSCWSFLRVNLKGGFQKMMYLRRDDLISDLVVHTCLQVFIAEQGFAFLSTMKISSVLWFVLRCHGDEFMQDDANGEDVV